MLIEITTVFLVLSIFPVSLGFHNIHHFDFNADYSLHLPFRPKANVMTHRAFKFNYSIMLDSSLISGPISVGLVAELASD